MADRMPHAACLPGSAGIIRSGVGQHDAFIAVGYHHDFCLAVSMLFAPLLAPLLAALLALFLSPPLAPLTIPNDR